jgi:hypothetical protein
LSSLLADDEVLSKLEYNLSLVQAPTEAAQTKEHHVEWSKIWPIAFLPVRTGSKGELSGGPKADWPKEKLDWVEREAARVVKVAKEAKDKGEVQELFS